MESKGLLAPSKTEFHCCYPWKESKDVCLKYIALFQAYIFVFLPRVTTVLRLEQGEVVALICKIMEVIRPRRLEPTKSNFPQKLFSLKVGLRKRQVKFCMTKISGKA